MKTVLVAGASGNTGRPLVEQLLAMGHTVRVIVRSRHRLPAAVLEHPNIAVIEVSILDLSHEQMGELVTGCDAVVSCLGHIISFRGIFGAPKKAVHRGHTPGMRCHSIESPDIAHQVHFDEHGGGAEPRAPGGETVV